MSNWTYPEQVITTKVAREVFTPPVEVAGVVDAGGGSGGGSGAVSAGQVVTICLVDVDGANLTEFVRAFTVSVDDAGVVTSVPLGDFTDETLSAPYVFMGVPTDPCDVGDAALTRLDHIVLKDGDTWSPGSMVHGFGVVVVAGEPELVGSNGVTTQLRVGQSVSWSRTDDAPLDPAFALTARAGSADCISITVNSLG